jgi:hypothetical protein
MDPDAHTVANDLRCLARTIEKSGDTIDINTRNEVVAQAKRLINSLLTPEEDVLQRCAQAMEAFAIRLIMKIGVLEALPADGTISLEEVIKATGAQDSLIERPLQLLVGTGFIYQDEKGRYGHTRVSRAYLGAAGDYFAGILYDTIIATLSRYPEYLEAHPELVEPHDITQTPFTFRFGEDGDTFWDVFARRPQLLDRFQKGFQMLSPMTPGTGYYPFKSLATEEDVPVLVDVGMRLRTPE